MCVEGLAVTGPLPVVHGLTPYSLALQAQVQEFKRAVDWMQQQLLEAKAFEGLSKGLQDRVQVGTRGRAAFVMLPAFKFSPTGTHPAHVPFNPCPMPSNRCKFF